MIMVLRLALVAVLSITGTVSAADPPKPIKVFILAGQSNMEGKAKVSLMDYQAGQPATRALFAEGYGTRADLKSHYPALAGKGYEVAGFVWFQGWNEMISAEATAEYTANLAHFIRDVRKDFKTPGLPFVVGELGVDGASPG